jgi:hypothetical protein
MTAAWGGVTGLIGGFGPAGRCPSGIIGEGPIAATAAVAGWNARFERVAVGLQRIERRGVEAAAL